jgi:hypothetical protein
LRFRAHNSLDAFLPIAFHALDIAAVMKIPAVAHMRRDEDDPAEKYSLVVKEDDSRSFSLNFCLMIVRMAVVFHADPADSAAAGVSDAGLSNAGLEKNTLLHGKMSYAISKSM